MVTRTIFITELAAILAKHYRRNYCHIVSAMIGPPPVLHKIGSGKHLTIEVDLRDQQFVSDDNEGEDE